ncbi:hypothetical protein KY382_32930 [Pseudomonas monteilii]|nr:hypothetical protein [Pseudomonas monteilii]
MDKVTIGFAPTRRNLFSAEAAIEYANLTRQKMDELAIDYVDILDINEDGLLYDDEGVEKIAEKFKAAKIDGLFLANENFGTEYACARLARLTMGTQRRDASRRRFTFAGYAMRSFRYRESLAPFQGTFHLCQKF